MSLNHAYESNPIQDDVYSELKKYSGIVSEMVEEAKHFEIQSRIDIDQALMFAEQARRLSTKIEAIKKEITEPARNFTSSINKTANNFTDNLETIQECLVAKIDKWKEARRNSEEVAIMLEFDVIPEKLDKIETDGITAYEKTEYKFEVLDIEQVPLVYLKVDEKQVQHLMSLGVRHVPGLRVWTEQKTYLRIK